jgi:flagellar basal-body rod protein FlgC
MRPSGVNHRDITVEDIRCRASAMTAQSQRLNVVASLANADSIGPDGQAYKAAGCVLREHGRRRCRYRRIEDPADERLYEPSHPMADASGYVTMPNVNVVEEMVNMISASRAYQNNVEAMNTAKTLLAKTLTIGQ